MTMTTALNQAGMIVSRRHFGLLDTILWGSLYTCASFFFFTSLSAFIESYLIPGHIRSSQNKSWKWTNYAVSFVHSTLSGLFAILCIYLTPSLLDDIILSYSETAYIACCISYGYFFYDTLDLINNHDKDKGNAELVVHHTFALTSATLVVFTKTYIGYGVIALLIELHSSILHSRVLMKMFLGISVNQSIFFKILQIINMIFFMLFRFGAIFYMLYGLYRDRGSAPSLGIYIFMISAVSVICFLSCLLFLRVFRSDFSPSSNVPKVDTTFEKIVQTTNVDSGMAPNNSGNLFLKSVQ